MAIFARPMLDQNMEEQRVIRVLLHTPKTIILKLPMQDFQSNIPNTQAYKGM